MKKNTRWNAFLAIQLAGAFGLAATYAANAESETKQCSDDWKAAEAARATSGESRQDFLRACRKRLAVPEQPTATPPSPVTSQQPDIVQTTPQSILSPGQYLYKANGNVYQYVSSPGITWSKAFTQAASKSINGVPGYLAAITSQAELDFIENTVIPGGAGTGNVYIGGRQVAPGKWAWAAGRDGVGLLE
jgi:hypothetical protein